MSDSDGPKMPVGFVYIYKPGEIVPTTAMRLRDGKIVRIDRFTNGGMQ